MSIESGIGTWGSADCEALGRLARAVVDQQAWLRENGHPAWKKVTYDVPALLARARLSPCVERALRG